MSKMKIIVIGPEEVGKTQISNIISDMPENDFSQYEPTEGVRILETEMVVKSDSSRDAKVEIELWDCAGSQRFQSCWPVIQLDTQGVIFVYNPQNSQQSSELELLYDYFVIQSGLSDINCMIFVNQRNNKGADATATLAQRFRSMPCKTINAASNSSGVKSQFSSFVEALWSELRRQRRSRS